MQKLELYRYIAYSAYNDAKSRATPHIFRSAGSNYVRIIYAYSNLYTNIGINHANIGVQGRIMSELYPHIVACI